MLSINVYYWIYEISFRNTYLSKMEVNNFIDSYFIISNLQNYSKIVYTSGISLTNIVNLLIIGDNNSEKLFCRNGAVEVDSV